MSELVSEPETLPIELRRVFLYTNSGNEINGFPLWICLDDLALHGLLSLPGSLDICLH